MFISALQKEAGGLGLTQRAWKKQQLKDIRKHSV